MAFGEIEHFDVGAAEFLPDLGDALGGFGRDFLGVFADLLLDRLGQFDADFVLRVGGFHLVGDDRQHAVTEIPDVLGDQDDTDAAGHDGDETADERADDALADAARHVRHLPANE